MRSVLVSSLGISLGLAAMSARGEELQWRPVLGPPVPAPAAVAPPAPAKPVPRVTLERPVWSGVSQQPAAQPAAAPSIFPANAERPVPEQVPWVARGQSPDFPVQVPAFPGGSTPLGPPRSMPRPQISESREPPGAGPTIGTGPVMSPPLPSGPMPSFQVPMPDCEAPLVDGVPFLADPMPRANQFYFSAEYLLWWMRSSGAPPLLTTSPARSDGIIGQPGTSTIFGGGPVGPTGRSGARFNAGWWFSECQNWGLDGSFFFLAPTRSEFAASSAAYPVIARPFFAANLGREFSELVSSPGFLTGTALVQTRSNFWGADLNLRKHLCGGCTWRLDGLAGFRFLNLDESLQITESFTGVPGNPVTGGLVGVVTDRFRTSNQFYGGQLGLLTQFQWNRWSLNLATKVALGETHQSIQIDGAQSIANPGMLPTLTPGGLLALPTNSGNFTRDRFAVVPEVSLNLGYDLTPHMRLFVGYNFLYWSSVVRPGDQINRNLDITQIPHFGVGGVQPVPFATPTNPFHATDLWVQGINFGIRFTW